MAYARAMRSRFVSAVGGRDLPVTSWEHSGCVGETGRVVCLDVQDRKLRTLTKRATVYLDPDIHRALRLQSIETSRSMSELINEAIRAELAQDASDLAAFDEREGESTLGFAEFVKGLKRDGTI